MSINKVLLFQALGGTSETFTEPTFQRQSGGGHSSGRGRGLTEQDKEEFEGRNWILFIFDSPELQRSLTNAP